MPSDPRRDRAVTVLAPAAAAFDAMLDLTLVEVEALIDADDAEDDPRAAIAAELGPFGAQHVDLDRFARHFAPGSDLPPSGLEAVRTAAAVLRDVHSLGPRLWQRPVRHGLSLHETVRRGLADVGRAFVAARVVSQAIQNGSAMPAMSDLQGFGFERWNRTERLMAPPLLVRVAGTDLRPAALSEFLDGRVRLLLLVDGPCPIAPLARLVTPGTFVQQVVDPDALHDFAHWDGSGIAALVPEGAAEFVHDPVRGLTIETLPQPRAALGGVSVAQQREEIALLERLVGSRADGEADQPVDSAAGPADPAGQLAAWLLARVPLPDS